MARRNNCSFVANLISSLLPKNSLQLILTSEGIIGNDLKNYIEQNRYEYKIDKAFTSVEKEYPDLTATINGILLPQTSASYRFEVKQLVNITESNIQSTLLGIRNEYELLKFFGVNTGINILEYVSFFVVSSVIF